jgi:hypothetical protein
MDINYTMQFLFLLIFSPFYSGDFFCRAILNIFVMSLSSVTLVFFYMFFLQNFPKFEFDLTSFR